MDDCRGNLHVIFTFLALQAIALALILMYNRIRGIFGEYPPEGTQFQELQKGGEPGCYICRVRKARVW
jgi:hypothetical protein